MLLLIAVLSYISGHHMLNVLADEIITAGHFPVTGGDKLVDFDHLGRLLEALDFHLQDFQHVLCASIYVPNVREEKAGQVTLCFSSTPANKKDYIACWKMKRKRTCELGIHSNNCVLVNMVKQRVIDDYLKSGDSPGKRAKGLNFGMPDYGMTSDEHRAANAVLEDLVEQRQAVNTLRILLKAMKKDLDNMRTTKRDCRLRLGGHCLTESLDRAANQFYYLRSPDSPGRRRRQVLSLHIAQKSQFCDAYSTYSMTHLSTVAPGIKKMANSATKHMTRIENIIAAEYIKELVYIRSTIPV